ncbi:DMT family transporter [Bowmanella yangjiangensis]|uniref:EamA family transporter n=1 Tax=Bowmanella yangjiangensis TaxID=2811230 RepID=A0ABS3CRI5_9ALTE|nr:EamA family transporter [Bowmanella yangjiangensis]MBN7819727.1 EamA family transporter [Bowmanella yangjiangensis]
MKYLKDIVLTALAPFVWGSTYYVTTQFIPDGHPLAISLLRIVPAGLLLFLLVKEFPSRSLWVKLLILGTLNFALFWWLLFEAAYRLPGGIAATLGATQVILVIVLSKFVLQSKVTFSAVLFAGLGALGVGLMLFTPIDKLDLMGVLAGFASALSMALGTVLSKHWKPPVPTLTFTCWQLCAGGIVLSPFVIFLEVEFPSVTVASICAISYLSLIGAAFTYLLWFRGISKLSPNLISPLGLFSPISAVLLGWIMLDESLNAIQILGFISALISIVFCQHTQRPKRSRLN